MVDENKGTNCDNVVFVTRVRMEVVMKKIKMMKMVMMIGGSSGGGGDDGDGGGGGGGDGDGGDDDDDDDNGDVSVMSVGKHDYLFFFLSQVNKVDGESCIGSVDRDFFSLSLSFSVSLFRTFFPQ